MGIERHLVKHNFTVFFVTPVSLRIWLASFAADVLFFPRIKFAPNVIYPPILLGNQFRFSNNIISKNVCAIYYAREGDGNRDGAVRAGADSDEKYSDQTDRKTFRCVHNPVDISCLFGFCCGFGFAFGVFDGMDSVANAE